MDFIDVSVCVVQGEYKHKHNTRLVWICVPAVGPARYARQQGPLLKFLLGHSFQGNVKGLI